jgi:hypothetical protein
MVVQRKSALLDTFISNTASLEVYHFQRGTVDSHSENHRIAYGCKIIRILYSTV